MTGVLRGPRRAALTVFAGVLVLLAHARVTVAPGCAIPAPALVLAAGVALCAAAAWLAIRLSYALLCPACCRA